jgi:hypothetical protein
MTEAADITFSVPLDQAAAGAEIGGDAGGS